MIIRRCGQAFGPLVRQSLSGSLLFAVLVAGCEMLPPPDGPNGLRSPAAPNAPAPSGSNRAGAGEPAPAVPDTPAPEPAPAEIVALPPPKPQPPAKADEPAPPAAKTGAPATAAAAAPAPDAVAAPPPDLRRLIGSNEAQVVEVLGPPGGTRQSPPATIWRYDLEGCRVDVFFYLDLGSQTLRALSYELSEIPGGAQTPDWCVTPPEKPTKDGAQ